MSCGDWPIRSFKIDIAGEGWLRDEFHCFPEDAEARLWRTHFALRDGAWICALHGIEFRKRRLILSCNRQTTRSLDDDDASVG
jgi:hypothetical protein